jgi:hypothetical protein
MLGESLDLRSSETWVFFLFSNRRGRGAHAFSVLCCASCQTLLTGIAWRRNAEEQDALARSVRSPRWPVGGEVEWVEASLIFRGSTRRAQREILRLRFAPLRMTKLIQSRVRLGETPAISESAACCTRSVGWLLGWQHRPLRRQRCLLINAPALTRARRPGSR